jgi:hypothetical protein
MPETVTEISPRMYRDILFPPYIAPSLAFPLCSCLFFPPIFSERQLISAKRGINKQRVKYQMAKIQYQIRAHCFTGYGSSIFTTHGPPTFTTFGKELYSISDR